MANPTVSIGVVRMLLGTGVACGLRRDVLLEVVGIAESDMIEPDVQIPISDHLALGAHIIAARPGVNISMVALRHIGLGSLGVLGYCLRHCVDLRSALGTFVRFQSLMTTGVIWRTTRDRLHVGVLPEISAQGHPVETIMGLWVVLGRQLTGERWAPLAIHFRHQPLGDPSEHAAFFGVAPVFGAEQDELLLGGALLEKRVVNADFRVRPALQTLLEARILSEPSAGIRGQVTSALRELLLRGEGTKRQVARALGMSARTLGRQLRTAGVGFQEVHDDVRRQLAEHWLADPQLAIYEVALLLGYSESSSFYRAFRRWTGKTPAAWRRLAHARK